MFKSVLQYVTIRQELNRNLRSSKDKGRLLHCLCKSHVNKNCKNKWKEESWWPRLHRQHLHVEQQTCWIISKLSTKALLKEILMNRQDLVERGMLLSSLCNQESNSQGLAESCILKKRKKGTAKVVPMLTINTVHIKHVQQRMHLINVGEANTHHHAIVQWCILLFLGFPDEVQSSSSFIWSRPFRYPVKKMQPLRHSCSFTNFNWFSQVSQPAIFC